MDLKLFFDALSEDEVPSNLPEDSLFKFIYVNEHRMPDEDGLQIAIIGLDDVRGNTNLSQGGIKEIRKKLYTLKKGSTACNIADLGNLRLGETIGETYKRLSSVVSILISKSILPIIVGGSHDMDIGQFLAYEIEERYVSILNVDSRFDIDKNDEKNPSNSHLATIFKSDHKYLFNYSQLAHQSYLVSPSGEMELESLKFQAVRVGAIREDIKKVEPIIREADMVTFDVSSIKTQYCPGGSRSEVFGLTGEEACQITWYAGMNDKLSSIGFYEYDPAKDDANKSSAMTIAVMIWYFIEGFKNRKNEKGFQTKDYLKYVVSMDTDPETISFYKSILSEKWWMEVPNNSSIGVFDRNQIIPCDFSDYELASKGEVPERWVNAYSKKVE